MVGAVGRTDLCGPEQTETDGPGPVPLPPRASSLCCPTTCAVYPTHGAGSFCSAPAGGERTTTIGRERATNPLLAAPDEDTFVDRLLAGLGTYPGLLRRLRELNRHGPRRYGTFPTLARLDVATTRRFAADGAALVDVRPVDRFAAGHIPGSLSIPLRPQFASWLGWLVDPDQPVVFVVDDDQDRADLVRQCLNIGYEHLAGELDGGLDAWTGERQPVERVPSSSPARAGPTAMVDVRQAAEYAAGHVPGAVNIELGSPSHSDADARPGP